MSASSMSALSLGSPCDSVATDRTWDLEAEQGDENIYEHHLFLKILVLDVSYDSIYATPTRVIPMAKKKKRIR